MRVGPSGPEPPLAPPAPAERLAPVRAILRAAIGGLLLLTPLPFGSVQPVSILSIELAAATLGGLAIWTRGVEGARWARNGLPYVAPIVLVLLVGAIQLVPGPGAWTRLVSPATARLRDAVVTALPEAGEPIGPASLAPPDTLDAWLRLVAYALLGFATFCAFRTPTQLRRLALVLVGSGAFQAIYGSLEFLSGRQQIFGYVKRHYLEEATGTFINRNHFAAYLALTLPFAIGLLLFRPHAPAPRTLRATLLRSLSPSRLAGLLAGVAAVCMGIGLLLSHSRSGLAAATLGIATLATRAGLGRRALLAVVAVLALPALFLLGSQVRAPGERFVRIAHDLASPTGRIPLWRESLAIVSSHPALGSGLGTFESAYRLEQASSAPLRVDHAHNDWLESLAEGGPVTAAAFLVLLVLALRLGLRREAASSPGAAASRCAAAGIAACALHAFADFPLRIPAIATTVAVLFAILLRGGLEPAGAVVLARERRRARLA